jgi:valyl-tRNA synthetase
VQRRRRGTVGAPMELPKHYDPKSVEPRLYHRWEQCGYFHEDPDPARPPFIICMPPPNVTGRAHLGHASTYTPMDVLTRYHRMLGDNADWLPGTDHAAIATEAVLVRELHKEGLTREALGRERFVERAWQWSRTYGGEIEDQFRSLGFGPDWQRSRFTMDDALSAAVRKVFVRLYREGLIYRGKRLINWDPKGKTTVSDAEVEHVERDATLWFVRYPLSGDRSQSIDVATTRPETMLGDVAIAVHPRDERYAGFVGKSVLLPPLLQRAIPIVADESVDPAFGTGAVKVTPAHDPMDYEIGLRHQLPMPSVMNLEAQMSGSEIPIGPYEGLDRFAARERVVTALRDQGLLVKEQAYRHSIAISDRSGDVIEPLLSLQWFVKMNSLVKPALAAYREGRLRFVPERHGSVYDRWLEGIHDWNISRQIWWGHQLPVWYTPNGEPVVAETEDEAREIAQREHRTRELTRDPDTLDTWFSSALWPFSILGWPDKTPELECWYPSQTMVTSRDIIPLWVARMVMLGIHFMEELPFRDVFVTPLVFDAFGNKMSKSLGNAIDPMDLVDTYGADAFRMGLLRQMHLESQELRFQESRCAEARNFNNKIWNATRYVLGLSEGLPGALVLPTAETLTLADRWILVRLHDTIVTLSRLLNAYDFGAAAETIWRFIWYEFCDWYVEATKVAENQRTRAAVLSFVWNNAMRLLHPIEPFISEEVWLALPHDGQTIVTAAWPDPLELPVDRQAEAVFETVRQVVERLRNEKAAAGLALGQKVPATVPAPLEGKQVLSFVLAASGCTPSFIPARGAAEDPAKLLSLISIDRPLPERERRYRKEIARLRAEVDRLERKLSNGEFVAKAAPGVVAKERSKLDGYREELARAQSELAAVGGSAKP